MSKPTICLAVMVKDEARIITRMLASALPHVEAVCVLDTGSTDGTVQMAEDYLTENGAKYRIHEELFIDFAASRNRLLYFARKMGCEYLLLLDADHIIHVEDGALDSLSNACYLIQLRGGLDYYMPYLIRSDADAQYFYPTHEYLGFKGNVIQERLSGVWLEHLEDGGTRHEKFERDEAILEKEYALNPSNERTLFYLAQTIEHKDPQRAIDLYRRRFRLSGWDEERYVAMVRAARLSGDVNDWMTAWNFRPQRWEAVTGLVKNLHERGQYHAAYVIGSSAIRNPRDPGDLLFVEPEAGGWSFDFEFSLAAYYAGAQDQARQIWRDLVNRDDVPQPIREAAERNLQF